MALDFKFPDVGEGIHEGRLVEWLVAEGDPVTVDQPFVKVETDKAVVDLPAPVAGTMLKHHFPAGEIIRVGQVLASFGGSSELRVESSEPGQEAVQSSKYKVQSGELGALQPETRDSKLETPKAAGSPQPLATNPSSEFGVRSPESGQKAVPGSKFQVPGGEPGAHKLESPAPQLETRNSKPETAAPAARPPATPHTRALARKLGVDLAQVSATGPRGRITDEDVEKAAVSFQPSAVSRSSEFGVRSSETGQKPVPSSKFQVPSGEPGAPQPETRNSKLETPLRPIPSYASSSDEAEAVERVPISYLRKRIAEHMTASKTTSAHVTHVDEADVTELFAMYKQAKEEVRSAYGLNLTILPFFMKAIVAALREHPLFNASYDADKGELLMKKFYHIGIAVDTPEGLIVPVVKHVEHKNMLTLASELQTLGDKARSRALSLDELKGATITITNIGPIGGLFATPIINQPNLAIIALGVVKDRPVVHEGAIAIRKMIYFSVSFDHRIIDGAAAARFVNALVGIVSRPGLLMAGV